MEMVAQGYEITGEALRSLPAGNGDPSGPQSRHIPTTFVIDGAGDEATMRSDVTVVGVGDGAEHARLHERRRGARHDGPGRTDTLPPECPPVACHSVSASDEDGIDGRGPARWKVASECSSRNQDETYDSIRRRVERTDPKRGRTSSRGSARRRYQVRTPHLPRRGLDVYARRCASLRSTAPLVPAGCRSLATAVRPSTRSRRRCQRRRERALSPTRHPPNGVHSGRSVTLTYRSVFRYARAASRSTGAESWS